jgi:hypothetical protein
MAEMLASRDGTKPKRNVETMLKTIRRVLVALGLVAAGLAPAWAEDVVGKWTGNVKAPDGDVPFVLTVTKDAAGKLTAIGESPAQAPGVQIPAENVVSDGAKLTFDVSMVAGNYAGTWDDAKKAWVGTWKQGGIDMPLQFTRTP